MFNRLAIMDAVRRIPPTPTHHNRHNRPKCPACKAGRSGSHVIGVRGPMVGSNAIGVSRPRMRLKHRDPVSCPGQLPWRFDERPPTP